MKYKRSLLSILIIIVLASLALSGCSEKEPDVVCPFTELSWDATYDDMVKLEGKDYESYPSVYSGTTYSYPMKYMDQEGTLKYMYDDKDVLMSVAWACDGDVDTLDKIYNTIHKELVDTYGESGYNTGNVTNYGDVWYLEGGHIILSAVTTEQQKALQYSYQNPAASEEEAEADTAEEDENIKE